jgi:hypothetical protein
MISANLKNRLKAARARGGAREKPSAVEILLVAISRIPVRFVPLLTGAALSGCILGGNLDSPPAKYSPLDTAIVFVPPKDTATGNDSLPVANGSRKSLYARLNPGEKWVFSQKGDGYSGATVSIEVIKDSLYGVDSVYVESITVQVPIFFSPYGDTVRNYTQSGRLYLRKSDQETVHDTVTTLADIHYVDDSVSSTYRMDAASVSTFTGALPDSLKAGAAWSLVAKRHATTTWGWDGLPYGSRDTAWTDTLDHSVAASDPVTVDAGTFPVLKVGWATRGSESASVGWYAPAAKAMIREIDGTASAADTTELSAFTIR